MSFQQSVANDADEKEKASEINPKVGYVYNHELLRLTNRLPQVQGRAQLVHELIGAYGLLDKCQLIGFSRPCSRTDLLAFHTEQFLEYVLKNSCKNDLELTELQERAEIERQNRKGIKRSRREAEKEDKVDRRRKEAVKERGRSWGETKKNNNKLKLEKAGEAIRNGGDMERGSNTEVVSEGRITQKTDKEEINPTKNDIEHEIMLNDTLDNTELLIRSRDEEEEEYQERSREGSIGEDNDENDNPFGFAYDCPLIVNLNDTIAHLAAGSIAGARAIIERKCHYSINWNGGWHHAHRDEVSGYCYTNDIVFAILTFLKAGYRRILYIDLDLHHGDGVENAFAHTNKVITLSFHKHELGFFPGSGALDPQNRDEKCRYSSLNVPLKNGLVDEQFVWIFTNVIENLLTKIQPEVIVCQCGADGLSGDRMQSWALTEKSYKECISLLLSKEIPILFLGGGGYNLPNTARLWTALTGLIVDRDESLEEDIPEHEYFLHYGPGYELPISQSFLPNRNSQTDLQMILDQISQHISKLSL